MIEVKVNEVQEPKQPEYPKLMKSNSSDSDLVVLFTSRSTGVALICTDHGPLVGSYDDDWHEGSFSEYTGTLLLSNK